MNGVCHADYLLTAEEELRLANLCSNGDISARNRLVLSVENIIVSEAIRSCRVCRTTVDDLASDLRLHLLTESHKYNHTDGHRFVYFAKSVCRFKVKYFLRQSKMVKNTVPEQVWSFDDYASKQASSYHEELNIVRESLKVLTYKQLKVFTSRFNIEDCSIIPRRDIWEKCGYKNINSFDQMFGLAVSKVKEHIKNIHPDFRFTSKNAKTTHTMAKRNPHDRKRGWNPRRNAK